MFDQINDIRIEMKIRNNLLLSAMERKGIASLAELCRKMGPPNNSYIQVTQLAAMKIPARTKTSQEWRPVVLRLSEFFKCMPDDLFSDPQQHAALKINRTYAETTFAELQRLSARRQEPATPELEAQAKQLREVLGETLESLTERERRVLLMRFGFETGEEMTLKNVAEDLGISLERVRQIEGKALRKLRNPFRSRNIKRIACTAVGTREDSMGEERKTVALDTDLLSSL